MQSVVHWAEARSRHASDALMVRLGRLLDNAGLQELFSKGDHVGIKIDVGELGCTSYLRPVLVRAIVEKVLELGGEPIPLDTTRIGRTGFHPGRDWLDKALANGYTAATFGREVILADGYTGDESELLPVEGEELGGVEVARGIVDVMALIVVSHVTGHPFAGLSGALVNFGLGGLARRGKVRVHAPIRPVVALDRCDGCGACLAHCPWEAIGRKDSTVLVSVASCAGCGECIPACPVRALGVRSSSVASYQKRVAEAATAMRVATLGKVHYFSFLLDVGPYPDQYPFSDVALVPDLGVLSARDPVAIDQASLDLINAAPAVPGSAAEEKGTLDPHTDKLSAVLGASPRVLLDSAERLGLGTRNYRLVAA